MQKLDPVKVSWDNQSKRERNEKYQCYLIHEDICTLGAEIVFTISQFRKYSSLVENQVGPRRIVTDQMTKTVQVAFEKFKCCAVFLEKIIDADGIHIPHNTIHQILRNKGLAEAQPKKRRKRKWVRFERTYSNSMWAY